MKIVYQADDGTVWNSEELETRRDSILFDVYAALRHWNRIKVSGEESVVRSTEDIDRLINAGAYNLRETCHDDWANMFAINPWGIVGRYLDNSHHPVARISNALYCVDSFDNRQYSQPYYAFEAKRQREENNAATK